MEFFTSIWSTKCPRILAFYPQIFKKKFQIFFKVINISQHLSLCLAGSVMLEYLKTSYRLVSVIIDALLLFYLILRERKYVLMTLFILFRIKVSLMANNMFSVESWQYRYRSKSLNIPVLSKVRWFCRI